ncbi:hypothetical protein GWI33_004563 [Rhynchophorus ferrugineus]|uniref:C2H2-type domain-containing protein n=1 Tax=Rhynchophorus ferrugineus TaxID=354439 RepID=A0A834IM22_RHYFE|nr:hypothetical protein GWI33_004563 [Rhynchophorus ferrugineus]
MSNNENATGINRQIPVETYKCTQCNFYTNHEFYLQQHNLKHSLQILMEQYRKNECNYDNDSQVPSYVKSHSLVPGKEFQCVQCNFCTTQELYYKQHLSSHNDQTMTDTYRVVPQRGFDEEDPYIKSSLNTMSSIEMYGARDFVREQQSSLKPHDLTQSTQTYDATFLRQSDLSTATLDPSKCIVFSCNLPVSEENTFKQNNLCSELQTPCPEMFRCTECDYESSHEEDLKHHIKQHQQVTKEGIKIEDEQSITEIFRCHNCDYETNLKAFLKRHMLNHTIKVKIKNEPTDKYKCLQCNFETDYEKFLKRHQLSHKEKHYYCCKMCNFETLYKKMYLLHIKGHKIKRKVSSAKTRECVKCDECDLEVGSKEQLQIHKKLRHTEKEVDNDLHKCMFCQYQTNWEPCLKRHIERMHTDEKEKKGEIKKEKVNDRKARIKKGTERDKTGVEEHEVFRCNNCTFFSTSKQYLILHLKTIHGRGQADTFQCKMKNCKFATVNKSTFLQHMAGHRGKIQRTKRPVGHFCDMCDFVSKNKERLADHKKKVHLNNLRQLYKCSQCDFKTVYQTSLKTHIEKHKKYECTICEQEVESAYALVKHRRTHQVNLKNRIFLCDVCGFQSKNDRSLKMHKKTHNPEFKCPDCPFETHSKVNFQNHCINHKGVDEVTMYPCPHCSYQSRLKRNLAWHMKRHVDPSKAKIFKCSHCNYQTFTNAQLKSHLMVHKSKEEVIMLKCDFCQFETKRKSNMVQHRLRHLKDSPDVPLLSCPDCNYTTVAKRHLNKHRKTHNVNPDKMFQCTYCPFKIHRKIYLIRHMENHKNTDAFPNDQWQRYSFPSQSNMGVTIVPNVGQGLQQNLGPSLI